MQTQNKVDLVSTVNNKGLYPVVPTCYSCFENRNSDVFKIYYHLRLFWFSLSHLGVVCQFMSKEVCLVCWYIISLKYSFVPREGLVAHSSKYSDDDVLLFP